MINSAKGKGPLRTPLLGLYRHLLLDRVWIFGLAVLNRAYNFNRLCPKQGQNLFLTGYGITSRDALTGHDKNINQHHIIFWTKMLLSAGKEKDFFHLSVLSEARFERIVCFHMTSLKFKLLILLIFYFHDALKRLETNIHKNFRSEWVLGFVIDYA